MIDLKFFRETIAEIAAEIPEITSALPITVDAEMAKRIQALKDGSVTLFILPPAAESRSSDPDGYAETNECLLFVMERYNPARRTAFEVLESVQPAAQRVVAALIEQTRSCPRLDVDLRSVNLAPETQFYAGFAGWSVGFKINSY